MYTHVYTCVYIYIYIYIYIAFGVLDLHLQLLHLPAVREHVRSKHVPSIIR